MTTERTTVATPTPAQPPDLRAVKGRQQATWAAGDYARIGNTVLLAAELLCEAVDLRGGQRVLDVAAGSGNAALAAARRFADATATDYVPALLDEARKRAAAEGLSLAFREADAEHLPFPEASFDVVLSTFGAMFAPDHERVARELARVCRPGGTIGMTNWTPEGFLGDFFRTMGRHVPPPAGVRSPMLWGSEDHLRGLFGESVSTLTATRRTFAFRQRSPRAWIDHFRAYYGPTLKAFESLDAAGQDRLVADLEALIARHNVATDGTMVVHAEYLEVVATRR
ncbi:MAG: class I SAM-dependent methyltransferase [Chloroflexota bacterium]|nr:class I SAM-dependent methyltransferase [Chloroflexota bacterium]